MSTEMVMVQSEMSVQLIKDVICKGATDTELQFFVSTAKRLGLDPLARQIFAVKRWDADLRREVMTPQTSVDGLRLVAERTGLYRGQIPLQWCGPDGKWIDIWLSSRPPAGARAGVYKEGFREPLVAVAAYSEYVQTKKDGEPNRMWSKMPATMLGKCAESLALRRAFPQELAGVYGTEEMGQADHDEDRPHRPAASSRTEQVRAALAPADDAPRALPAATTLDAVIVAIAAATSVEDLAAVGALAKELTADEQAVARETYRAKREALSTERHAFGAPRSMREPGDDTDHV